MDHNTSAQTIGKRQIVESLDREFARLHFRSVNLIENTPVEILYAAEETASVTGGSSAQLSRSIGDSVLRSAAAVEQTFGGITSNLWDDPFEWTLPEELSTPLKVVRHLGEVESTRQRAFSSFADDSCLVKLVATPTRETALVDLLHETLVRAVSFQSQAAVGLKKIAGISLPGFII